MGAELGHPKVRFLSSKPVLTGNAAVGDVRTAKTFYNTDPANKLTGTADLSEHQNAEGTIVGVTAGGSHLQYYNTVANGAAIKSVSITTAVRCLITVVSLTVGEASIQQCQIQRGGVDKTKETTISAVNFASADLYGHLQYATEVLDAGTYQYDVINTWGSNVDIYGCVMKIVAGTF